MRITRYTYPHARSLSPFFARSPWGGFDGEVDRLLGSVFGNTNGTASSGFFPVDLYEDKDNTYVRAELPGVARSDINVEVVDGNLSISATRKVSATDSKEEQTLSFKRNVLIPENTLGEKISATYENGILTVTLPKQEEVKPKKFTVSVN